ncbi:MAG: hypothetical protein GXP43_03530, partial [bacterium]|nr:hypothetical protein [bacterium]
MALKYYEVMYEGADRKDWGAVTKTVRLMFEIEGETFPAELSRLPTPHIPVIPGVENNMRRLNACVFLIDRIIDLQHHGGRIFNRSQSARLKNCLYYDAGFETLLDKKSQAKDFEDLVEAMIPHLPEKERAEFEAVRVAVSRLQRASRREYLSGE